MDKDLEKQFVQAFFYRNFRERILCSLAFAFV